MACAGKTLSKYACVAQRYLEHQHKTT
jgi:hypothetical protein